LPVQQVKLQPVTRGDVGRIKEWLEDAEVSESWFGRYSYGEPAHLGYHPEQMAHASDLEWTAVFDNPEHKFTSIYTLAGEHIGEVHVAIEESLGDGQLSILVGRKDLWHHGYGTAALGETLRLAFHEWGLFRLWMDIPEYNSAARTLAEHMGFAHEGTLRKSRPHEGARFDSVVMGILAGEYEEHEVADLEHTV